MDKIDTFIIHGDQIGGNIEFRFVIVEKDISVFVENVIDYIDDFTRKLNLEIPQFKFTWEVAHKILPIEYIKEVIHQILVQRGK